LGALEDDLLRRDFTINAMAEDEHGNIIDLFNGLEHLKEKRLKTPQPVKKSFDDDPLRILRAIRFAITKDMTIPYMLDYEIRNYDYDEKMHVVSTERIREELYKCFKHDTLLTLNYLDQFSSLCYYIFKNNILWLKPTMEQ
jgi:tRNA nucleotidyltransferase/poly(A) polymerase